MPAAINPQICHCPLPGTNAPDPVGHTHLSMPDPEGSTRLDVIRHNLGTCSADCPLCTNF